MVSKVKGRILELIDEFISIQDVADNSKKVYRSNLLTFFRYVFRTIKKDEWQLTRVDVIEYKRYLIDKKYSNLTIDSRITTLRKFYKYLSDLALYENIMLGVKNPPKYSGFKKKPLNDIQISALIKNLKCDTEIEKRNFAIIWIMLETGIRSVEVTRLDYSDIIITNDFSGLKIQRKGSVEKNQSIPVSPDTINVLQDYLILRKDLNEASPVFVGYGRNAYMQRLSSIGVTQIVVTQMKKVGIKENMISAHSLRHTYAVNMIRQGKGLYEVQKLLGHKNANMTINYTRYIEDEVRMKSDAPILMAKLLNRLRNE